jgi:hypothetical protein
MHANPRPALICFAGALFSGAFSTVPAWPQTAAQDPQACVRRAVHNDLSIHDGINVRFTLRKSDEKGVSTKQIIETKDGDVARLVALGDKPLSPEANQAELDRLNELLNDPAKQQHRLKREQADAQRGDELFQVLPDAFLYKFIGMGEAPNGPVYRFSFVPNPNFVPPDYEARVFHGMQGELWVDQKQERVVRFDAHLVADVEFGWGVLGRLYKGGTIQVQQQDVAGNGLHHWEQTLLKLDLTGKEMMFKDLVERNTEQESDFSIVPSTWTYKDAIHALEAGPGK